MKILAIIPARGGSKGIKNKNIKKFAGKPLLSYAIKVAQSSKFINRIMVSTESEEIARVAKKYGAEVPFLRPMELAQDNSKVSDAIVHLLDNLRSNEGYEPDYIVLLQTTSPMREVNDVDGAIATLLEKQDNADAILSICRTEQLLFTLNETGCLQLVSSEEFLKTSNRQELPKTYKCDGSMVYVIKTKTFLEKKTFLPPRTLGYAIPRWRAVDLDDPEDFVVGELIYKNRNKIKTKLKKFK